jgi:thiamine biosynthesis lipoprotein
VTATDVAPVATARRRAIGTEAMLVVTAPQLLAEAARVMADELDAIDRTCSRFRPDSEIANLERAAGRWVRVSALLYEALDCALGAARATGGAVDPTVGRAIDALGYDRDFKQIASDGPPTPEPVPAPGWHVVELEPATRRARVPPGVGLDLGATAKALVADRIAAAVAALGAGVVVSIGGDVSIAGPAPGAGWSIGVAADSGSTSDVEEVVAMSSGGMATTSTQSRSWRRGARRVHHVVDPATGDCATALWQTVTVAAGTCVEANTASTAAVVWGDDAPDRLTGVGLASRLVRHDGVVVTTAGWPSR